MRKITAAAVTAVITVAGLLAGSPAQAQSAPAGPTFSKDIAPILQRSCQACHRPGMMAPMSLLTYQDARPLARAIKSKVSNREMPPWFIDRNVGIQKFKNDRSLTEDQHATIMKWIEAGAPQGDPKDMPAPVQWPEDQGWNFAAQFGQKEPDIIVKSEPFTMPAVSQDAWDKRITELGITEPRWVH